MKEEVEVEVEETPLTVTNYKVSWKTKPLHSLLKDYKKVLDEKEEVAGVVSRSNFLVVRLLVDPRCVYTIFQSGFVNCTGLRSMQKCNEAVSRYKSWFNLDLVEGFKVDCLSAHCHLGRRVDLKKIQNNHPFDFDVRISFCPEVFAGCILRFSGGRVQGSASVFGNGKVTFVGVKSEREVNILYHAVKFILKTSAWHERWNRALPPSTISDLL